MSSLVLHGIIAIILNKTYSLFYYSQFIENYLNLTVNVQNNYEKEWVGMNRLLCVIIFLLLFVFIVSCSKNNMQIETDTTITNSITNTETKSDNSEQNVFYSEFTYDEWKNRINYNEYIEYVDSNDNIKMTIRIYKIHDEEGESVIENTSPIPMTVMVENIGNEDIFQITPNCCTEPEEKHHHKIWEIYPAIKDKYGNCLYDAPEWTGHEEMVGLYKMSPGDSFEYLYCLSVGDVYEPWIGQDKIDKVHEMGYKISFDEFWVHDIFIKLYDYSCYSIEEVHFTGPIGFSYKFVDGYTTYNTDNFSIDIDIPVTIVR